MARTQVKRSVHKKQSAPRSKQPRKPNPRTKKRRSTNDGHLAPGRLVLNEKNLPGRRFVEFPLARGKTTEKVELFTTGEYHSITIDFQDQTSLNLEIEPNFTINAEFQQLKKGETEVLAEWPPIRSQT